MRLRIEKFKVEEIHRLQEEGFVKRLFGLAKTEYHFDTMIKVSNDDRIKLSGLRERIDHLELPNKVRLLVWQVDIGRGIIRAKTLNWIKVDIRKYHPMEFFLVYSRRHGHIDDRDRI